MCGISGIYNFAGGAVDGKLVKRMCRIIAHRGPNDEGYYLDARVGLGCMRLSIIDLQTGHQPISNEDGTKWIVYNGECYNFAELKKKLRQSGHNFKTRSDTEVILHAYEEYGPGCVRLLNGMFAFAIYDQATKNLFIARDRSGIKPLYYTVVGNRFLFSSEIKGILQFEEVRRRVDRDAFHFLLNIRYVPGEMTLFEGIRRLQAGSYLTIEKSGRITRRKYWAQRMSPLIRSEDYWISKVRETLKDAVTRHMISDVPIGIYLSGGIDSSTIVALASRVSSEPLVTFCMGFGEYNDELADASRVAEHFGTNHRDFVIYASLLKEFPKMIWYADMPKRNLYPYYIAEIASRYVKVVLSGVGGDEVFGGYDYKYDNFIRIENLRRSVRPPGLWLSKASIESITEFQATYGDPEEDVSLTYLEKIENLNDDARLYVMFQSVDRPFVDIFLKEMYGSAMRGKKQKTIVQFFRPLFSRRNGNSLLERTMYADFCVKMTDDFLFVEDSTSMAHSLEARVPFLDNELLDLSAQIPVEMKYGHGQSKYILKRAMKRYLPRSVIAKRKQGFSPNTYSTYELELRDIAEQILPNGYATKNGLIKRSYIDRILRNRPSPKLSLHYNVLWTLVGFEIWWGMYIERKPSQPTFNIYKLIS